MKLWKRISKLEKDSEDYQKYNKKHYIPIMLPFSMLTITIVSPAIIYWLCDTDIYVSSINTILETMNEAVFL